MAADAAGAGEVSVGAAACDATPEDGVPGVASGSDAQPHTDNSVTDANAKRLNVRLRFRTSMLPECQVNS